MIKKIKILGHEYKVIHENISFKEGTAGMCSPQALEIKIDTFHPESRQREALLHEIIEALDYHFELKMPHNQIVSLSEGLYQVLKDNKGILR